MRALAKRDVVARILVFVLALGLWSCTSMQTDLAPGGELKSYKRAYIEALPQDEFQIYRALYHELNDMGMEVVGVPFKNPTASDLVVKYSYDAGWDVTRYLQAFQIRFMDAKSGRVVAVSSFRSRGVWLGVRDQRLETAFNDLRAKNGYPPTRQFQTKQ